MKTEVNKIDLKVKMKLWGTKWVITPMIIIVLILLITGNSEALRDGKIWYVLIIGLFGSMIITSKTPYITILILIALCVLHAFKGFKPDEAITISCLFVIVGIIYDHYLLRKESKCRSIAKSEKKEYLDLMHEALEKKISHLYKKREYYNLKSDKLTESLEHEEKEFEEAKKFSGDTRNFEKSIERKKIEIEKIKDLLKKDQEISDDLTSALDAIQAQQKSMRLA